MQFSLDNGCMRVTGVPPGTARLLVLLNGVRCYQQDHGGVEDTASIPMREGFESSEMATTLPACRGGLLQLYAVNDDRRVLGSASQPNFCRAAMQRGADAVAITETPTRAVASALRTARETHRWEFPVGAAAVPRILHLRVAFERPAGADTDGPLADVRWVLPLGAQWGTINAATGIDKLTLQSAFSPVMPPGTEGVVQCEVAYTAGAPSELRYVVYHSATEQPEAAVPRTIPAAGRKLAVLVGVSKYTRRPAKRMSDLEYADDDIVMWYEYLRQVGYECAVFGDEFSPYPQWDGPATVRNVRQAVRNMVSRGCGPADRLVFITSSHGSGDGRGNSYLCLLPDPYEGTTTTERQGSYMDHELAADLSANGRNQSRNFVFIDACYSGGLIEELLDALPNVVGTTTCTRKGYGYDDAETCSGAWTNGFLSRKLAKHPRENLDLAQVFSDAQTKYVTAHPSRGDRPCFFGRCVGWCINTESDEAATLPRGVFTAQTWLSTI